MPKRGRDDSAERQAIAAIFTQHNPDKLANLDELVAKYGAGRLLELVTRKYCPAADGADAALPTNAQQQDQAEAEAEDGDDDDDDDEEEEEVDEITPLLKQALQLRGSASTEGDLAAYEAALRRTLDASVENPPSTAAAAESAMSALRHLALLLCQSSRDSEAALQLATLGYEYRLAPEVLGYALPPQTPAALTAAATAAAAADAPPGKCVWILDDALSPQLLGFMQRALAPSSPFWSEHDYDIDGSPRPYFSYLHSLPRVLSPCGQCGGKLRKTRLFAPFYTKNYHFTQTGSGQTWGNSKKDAFSAGDGEGGGTMLEKLLRAVYKLAVSQYPQVAEANFVEWWTHCRPHSSGHQFHFDSEDEGCGAQP
jgi:hypothetical protein